MKNLVSVGQINLSEGEGSLYKKAILCRTGKWMGMYGEVDVTQETLNLVANWVNANYASVINEHSYPPIQIEHERDARQTLGRVDISKEKLTVEEASKFNPLWDGHVLVGSLRIDCEEGKKNVDTGKFSHLSMSFDDEIGKLYEVSFVSVEAAEGSQVLKQGEDMSKEELEKANGKIKTLSAKVTTMQSNRSQVSLALIQLKDGIGERVKNLQAGVDDVIKLSRKAEILSKFKGFIREGKLTKAEFEKLDFAALSGMEENSLKFVLGGYESRKPSSDMAQYGDVQGVKGDSVNLSDEDYAKALEAQEKGQTINLSTEETPDNKGGEGDQDNLSGEDDDQEAYELSDVVEKIKEFKKELDELKKLAKLAQDEQEKINEEGDQ